MTAHSYAGDLAVLEPFVSPTGAISVLALDHRDAMKNAYARVGVHDVTEQNMLDAKARIIEALAPRASAMLLDTLAMSLPRPSHLGVFMPLEQQGHDNLDGGRLNRLIVHFNPARAAAVGANGCKLLLYYRPDHAASATLQLGLAAHAARQCHNHGLALVVEPKVYRLAGEDEDVYERQFGKHVIAAARDLSEVGADLLKLQYPGDLERCTLITAAASGVPWTLLGGEIDGEAFASQLLDSCQAGACGFIAGRAIWGDALALEPSAQTQWLQAHAKPLFERLCDITDMYARRIV